MKMTKNGTRMRYSGDRQRRQQGRLLRGTHWAADHTHNRYNSTGTDDFIDKEWEWEDVQKAADTRIVPGTSLETACRTRPASVRTRDQPRTAWRGRKQKGDSGQWAVGSGQRRPAVCWYPLQCALWSGWLPRCEALLGWGPRPHNNPSPPSTTPCCAHPPSEEGRPSRQEWG